MLLSKVNAARAILLSLGGYIAVKFWEQIEALIRSLLQSTPLPSETVTLGWVGIGVIVATVVLLVSTSVSLRSSLKSLLLPPTFEGQIFGENDNRFLVGGTICFKARYHGNLKNGYFTTKFRAQEFRAIHDTGREFEYLADYNTFDWRTKTGRLNGRGSGWLRKSHSSSWGHKIPFRFPSGKHKVTLVVLDATSPSPSQPLAEIQLNFTILSEDLMELRGTTAEGEQLPPNRSMFVSKPKKRNRLGTLH